MRLKRRKEKKNCNERNGHVWMMEAHPFFFCLFDSNFWMKRKSKKPDALNLNIEEEEEDDDDYETDEIIKNLDFMALFAHVEKKKKNEIFADGVTADPCFLT